jgi:bloom syndrome protein
LNSGINNTPLHRHHQHATTIQQYVVPIVRLLATLLRSSDFELPTSMVLNQALTQLKSGLSVDTLHATFKALWMTMEWRTSKDIRMPDPTMCYLALASLHPDGSFAHPKDITPPIAKLCRAIQLFIIKEVHILVDNGTAAYQSQAFDMLACYIREKENTSFNSLMSLQHFMTGIVLNSMSLPRIWWVDRENWHELLYQGKSFTYNQMGQVFKLMQDRIIDLWENRILLGSKLHIDYDVLSDNLQCSEPGYCFLDDDNNPFKMAQHFLGNYIFNDPNLKKQFMISVNGQSSVNGIRCRQWLLDLAELEGLLMVSTEMQAGAPARGTELTSMLIRNTKHRGRNVMALARYLSLVRQYDKTTNLMQGDRLIPHAIDAVNADILIQVHSLARPLARVCI